MGERASLIPDRKDVIDLLVCFALVLIALFAFESSYGGLTFLVVGAIAAAAGLAVAYVATRLSWPFLLMLLVGVAVYVVLSSALALSHYAIVGFIPSPESILEALTSAVTGWKELITTTPPVGSIGDLMVIPVVSGFLCGLLSFWLTARFSLTVLAVIPSAVVLGLGIAVGVNEPVSVVLHGAVYAGLAFAWLSWREHQRRPLLQGVGMNARQLVMGGAVLVLAGVVGYVIAPSLPGAEASERTIWRQTVTPPFDPRQYPSPLSAYRSYVKPGFDENEERKDAEVVFTVEGLPEGASVRLATMDAYDGLVWQVSAGEAGNPSLNDSGSFERIGAQLPSEFDGEIAEVVVTIGKYNDVWIPDVGEVLEMRFTGSAGGPDRDRELADSFRYNRATDTAATPLRLQEGDRYEMTVVLPPRIDDLAGEPIEPSVPRIGGTLPVAAIPQAFSTPDFLTIDDTGERLDRVRDLMIQTGAYSDGDIEAGHIRATAGHSAVRLTEFVQDYPGDPFVGNAEQYASAYALLFRDLGSLPTRVVMGFMPTDSSLDGPVEVLATDVEAWVEVPVQDVGWVGIYPTPPRDQLSSTSTSPQQPEPDYRTQNPPPPPLVDPEFENPATASGDAQAPDEDDRAAEDENDETASANADSGSGVLSSPVIIGAGIALTPFLLLLGFGLVVALLKVLRRRRRRSRGEPHQRIANGWTEVTDLATDLGHPVPDATTRREAAAFVGSSTVPLADRTDAAVWSGEELTDAEVDAYWADLSVTLGSMRSQVGWFDRLKAAMSIQSLRRSRNHERNGRG